MALSVLSHVGIWYSQHFGCRWRIVYMTTYSWPNRRETSLLTLKALPKYM